MAPRILSVRPFMFVAVTVFMFAVELEEDVRLRLLILLLLEAFIIAWTEDGAAVMLVGRFAR